MLKLKQTAVAVLALGSGVAFAGTMGPVCAPGNVTIPCEKTAWDFGAQALYLKPSYGTDIGYPAIYYTNNVGSTIQTINPNWSWGFQIEGSYHFNTGNDLDLNWYHLSKNTSGTYTVGSTFAVGGSGGLYAGAFNVNPKWDAVNLELGQEVDFSDMKMMRLHAGFQYARVHNNVNAYPRTSPAGTPLFTVSDSMTYNGFGPRFGADIVYDIGSGLDIYGKVAGALLIGTAKQSITGYTGASYAFFNLYQSRSATMVPELEGKLGAKYDYMMAQGDLAFDVGYMWVNYFNTVLHSATLSATQGTNAQGANFALNGLYFGLKWTGNV